uniref:Uncharacterized protein n=1 Tax=Vibrio sp. FF_273 TaxID=1652830 RepID=A0A0H3ZX87_9VIBR|nr:hypothetical protein [Vibrio sp. FF_273]
MVINFQVHFIVYDRGKRSLLPFCYVRCTEMSKSDLKFGY